MSMKRLETLVQFNSTTGNRAEAEVWFDSEVEEYCVKFFTLTVMTRNHLRKADYFTDDKADARGTASVQLKQMVGA